MARVIISRIGLRNTTSAAIHNSPATAWPLRRRVEGCGCADLVIFATVVIVRLLIIWMIASFNSVQDYPHNMFFPEKLNGLVNGLAWRLARSQYEQSGVGVLLDCQRIGQSGGG